MLENAIKEQIATINFTFHLIHMDPLLRPLADQQKAKFDQRSPVNPPGMSKSPDAKVN
jgi:hypothetical protein